MAITNRMTETEIRRNFQHYGLMFGFVPVYVGNAQSDAPLIEVRNWWPDWLLDVGHFLFDAFSLLATMVNPQFEPLFMIKLTGPIEQPRDCAKG